MVFRNEVSWSQSSVFPVLKMWYDDTTARLDRFSHIALNGFAELMQFLLICLIWWWDIFSWADFKRMNRHILSCYICDKMFIFLVLTFLIFVSNGTVSSKISIFSSFLNSWLFTKKFLSFTKTMPVSTGKLLTFKKGQ